ncbi:MAG: arsenate reductase ArsC [Candidatus Hydrothermarchaeota archaeon]|nr:arsenate reductase ArsC [Candidatus Hydrothermarchaeota archaeon]
MRVLFVCVGNSARSQMAEAIFNKIAGKKEARSAGTQPAEKVSRKAVAVMKEIGIDISTHTPKLLTREMVEKAERIITMGCLDSASCPLFLLEDKSKLEDWKLEDPRGMPIEKVREIRDEIGRRVEKLAGKY